MPRFDVTIAGELNLDLILYGLPEQLPPERELLADRMMLTLGSSSAIVAHNLAALGSRVGFQSRIGDDPLGQIALDRLQAKRCRYFAGAPRPRLNHDRAHRDPAPRSVAQYSHLLGNDRRNHAGKISTSTISPTRVTFIFLLTTCSERCVREWANYFNLLKSKGLTISLDTNDDPDDRWEGGLRGSPAPRRCLLAQRARSLQSGGHRRSGSRDPQAFEVSSAGRGETRPQRSAGAARRGALHGPPPAKLCRSIPSAPATASTPASCMSTFEDLTCQRAWPAATALAHSRLPAPAAPKPSATRSIANSFSGNARFYGRRPPSAVPTELT